MREAVMTQWRRYGSWGRKARSTSNRLDRVKQFHQNF
jgi:hypothetical protein